MKVHERVKIQCGICEKEVHNQNRLKAHIEQNHGQGNVGTIGSFCNKQQTNLKRHVQSIHEKYIKDKTCIFCAKSFSFQSSLKRHVKLVHA